MAGWVADKSWLLIMVLQIDSKNSATGALQSNILLRLMSAVTFIFPTRHIFGGNYEKKNNMEFFRFLFICAV